MTFPLISIIIPTYNRAHFIEETLKSIANQTYNNWECIIIDDGSNDETEAISLKYIQCDTRFKYFKRPVNKPKGANACRNYGFELSKGNFINWFDSDDLMAPRKLELQIESLLNCKKAPYTICQSLWFDKEKNLNLGLRSETITSENRFEDYCLQKNVWLTTAPLWRRSFLEENRLFFDESLHQSQEYDFHIKALSINDNYAVVNEPLVTIIKHKETISHNIHSDFDKVVSNLKVKTSIFLNFGNKISNQAKLKLHETLTLMFKELLILKEYKLARMYMLALIKTLKYIRFSFFKKSSFVLKLIIIFICYRVFGRGYKLIKPLV